MSAASSYFYLYTEPFLGVPPPWHWLFFCVGSLVLYLALVFLIWPKYKPTTREEVLRLDRIRFLHNVALCAFSVFSGVVALYEMHFKSDSLASYVSFFTSLLTRMEYNPALLNRMLCAPITDTFTMWTAYIFAFSKIWEWFDTFFLVTLSTPFAKEVLRAERNKNKPAAAAAAAAAAAPTDQRVSLAAPKKAAESSESGLTLLGVYHHATTFWLFLLVTNFSGTMRLGLLLNGGAAHSLMYAYYAAPKKFPFPAATITVVQIMQLIFVTYAWTITPSQCPEHRRFPKEHFFEFLSPYGMVPVFIVLFIKFFVERFILGKSKQE